MCASNSQMAHQKKKCCAPVCAYVYGGDASMTTY